MSDVMRPTIVLTGATGFLGSHLMAALLRIDYKLIIFGRNTDKETLEQRILKLLKWFGMEVPIGQIEMVETDFTKSLCGIDETLYSGLCEKADLMIHCASDTSFSELKREKVFKSNVHCLTNILTFASNAKVKFFHYISTAYVAGANVSLCKEMLPATKDFANVYEESKAEAEKIIAAFCHQHSIKLTLIRPSIVYGDSQSGRSLKFNALYYPIQALKNIRDIYLNDFQNHNGKKSHKYGMFMNDDGYFYLPLRIYLPKKGALNLIPVNYFVDASMKIIEDSQSGGIYHVTNNSAIELETIISYCKQFMRINGVEIVYDNADHHEMRNPAEELFDRLNEPYRYYMADQRVFDRVNTNNATFDMHPPVFSYEIFERCIDYAVQVGWGERVYSV